MERPHFVTTTLYVALAASNRAKVCPGVQKGSADCPNSQSVQEKTWR
jgi:hypothetical protein